MFATAAVVPPRTATAGPDTVTIRAKLGARAELIGTVRGVGYKLSRRDWIRVLHDPA